MSPTPADGPAPNPSPRRRWARATGLRLGLLSTAAAAGFGVYRVVDSAWLAWAVALFVTVNLWSIYLFVRYQNAPVPSATSGDSGGLGQTNVADDEQTVQHAAYQKVVHDLFPLASRPQLFSRPFKGAAEAWRRSGKQRPDDKSD